VDHDDGNTLAVILGATCTTHHLFNTRQHKQQLERQYKQEEFGAREKRAVLHKG